MTDKIQFHSDSLRDLKQYWNALHQELNRQWEQKKEIDSNITQMLQGKTKDEYMILSQKVDKSYVKLLESFMKMTNRMEKANYASKKLDETM